MRARVAAAVAVLACAGVAHAQDDTTEDDPTPMPGSFAPDVRDDTEEPVPVEQAGPALEKKKTSRRIYPRKLTRDRSIPFVCEVRATLDARGRPVSVTPDGCLDVALYDHTVRRVLKDRWVAPVPEGAEVALAVEYVPPVDQMDVPQDQTWRRRQRTTCQVHLEIEADGAVSVARAPEACGLSVERVAPSPASLFRGPSPEVCPVTFLVAGGAPTEVERFRCPLGLWSHARAVLDSITWPVAADHPGGPQPWSVILQFDAAPGDAEALSAQAPRAR